MSKLLEAMPHVGHPEYIGLLSAANAAPHEDAPWLILADWLEEHVCLAAAWERRRHVALRAVVSNPADDAPRLAYADLCERHGEPERVEFIRVQCELAKLPECAHIAQAQKRRLPCHYCDLRRRESELLERHWASWSPWSEGTTVTDRDEWGNTNNGRPWVVFRGGFVGMIQCSAEAFLAVADRLLWRPGQQAPCSRCEGAGWLNATVEPTGGPNVGGVPKRYVVEPPKVVRMGCAQCGGKLLEKGAGTVLRPMPPTAQPITEVRLTTWPDVMRMYELASKNGFGESPGNRIERWREILAAEWPGVDFHLPGDRP